MTRPVRCDLQDVFDFGAPLRSRPGGYLGQVAQMHDGIHAQGRNQAECDPGPVS